jgi:hypothetical protein
MQPDLFAPENLRRMAHRGGLATERDAARRILPQLSTLHRAVLEALQDHGALNDRELEQLPRFAQYGPSTIRKRRSELYQAGRLVADGKRDGLTAWRIAPEQLTTTTARKTA